VQPILLVLFFPIFPTLGLRLSISLSQSELVHFVRPSADLLFESVAASYRERAIAVVLAGTGSDGNMGVQAIKKMGGTVIAQDEQSAEFFGMPQAAIQTGMESLGAWCC
jgi:two-component system chemotaxis response regulator CheB